MTAYEKTVAAFIEREGLANLSTGPLRCDECNVPLECSACPQCGKDAGSMPTEPYCSSLPCDCCGDVLAGDREDAHGYNPTRKEIQEGYTICLDCVAYQANGTLPTPA